MLSLLLSPNYGLHIRTTHYVTFYALVSILNKQIEQRNVLAMSFHHYQSFRSWMSVNPISCQFDL